MPKRVQRKRTRGYKLPVGAVYVGRPSKWGNPFKAEKGKACGCRSAGECTHGGMTAQEAVDLYREISLPAKIKIRGHDIEELRGKDLACWCPLDQPCHADVLLVAANFTSPPTSTGGSDAE